MVSPINVALTSWCNIDQWRDITLLDQKVDFCVDCWRSSILVDQKTRVRYVHIHGMTALMMCSIQLELATSCNLECPNRFHLMVINYLLYLYIGGHPPNLSPILSKSGYILYFSMYFYKITILSLVQNE